MPTGPEPFRRCFSPPLNGIARSGAQEIREAGSPPHSENYGAPGPHVSPPSEPSPSPLPCASPPTFLQATGNPSCCPDFKQLLPLGQGVWEERPEATGQRSALFLPEVVRDLEKTEGGRVGSLTVTPHVCEFLCPSGQGVQGPGSLLRVLG